MDDLINELRGMNHRKNDDSFLIMGKDYLPIRFSMDNFHQIQIQINDSQPNDFASSALLFVDGGNSIIFESAGFCLGMIRTAVLKYTNNKRLMRDIKEFHVLIKEVNSENSDNLKFQVKTFPITSFDGLVFDPEDKSLKNGIERSSCSRLVPVIRRFAEIEHACEQDSEDASYIVMDGTLESRYPYEDTYLKKLFSTKKACALSKTCSLTTNNGTSITKKLLELSSSLNLFEWYYYPIVENNNALHDANIYFIKLNRRADYVFRFEAQKSGPEIDKLMNILSSNSRDPIFLGYPYGLVDVDSAARVTLDECKMMQTRLIIGLGKDWNELSKNLNSMNAHDILDKIKF